MADTLSRAQLDSLIDEAEDEVQDLCSVVVAALPASSYTLEIYRKAKVNIFSINRLWNFAVLAGQSNYTHHLDYSVK